MKIALILALALATPAKDDAPAKDDTPEQDDMLYIALTTRQCGKTRIRQDSKDFYVTGETRVNGTFPRLSGNYVFNGEELTRNGKPCKRVTSELPPDEASDAAMLEDRFGLPVFQLGPYDRAEWTVCRRLHKDKSIGEIVMPAGDQSKQCKSMFPSRRSGAIEHFWYVANCVPYCVDEDTSGNALEQISLYAPRTGGAYDSHHQTAGIAGRPRRRGGCMATRGAGAAGHDAGGRLAQRY